MQAIFQHATTNSQLNRLQAGSYPMLRRRLALLATILAAFAQNAVGAAIEHEFLAIDEGLANLLHIDERNPSKNWIVPTGHPQARDLQLIGGGRVLIGHDAGYTEFDITTGKVAKDVANYKGVTSVRRLPGGHTLLAGANLDGEKSVVVLEVDTATP